MKYNIYFNESVMNLCTGLQLYCGHGRIAPLQGGVALGPLQSLPSPHEAPDRAHAGFWAYPKEGGFPCGTNPS